MVLVHARCFPYRPMAGAPNLNYLKPELFSWNDRYREAPAPVEPCQILTDFSYCLPTSGRALDIACGGGRNTVFLARHGLRAIGIDLSRKALEQGRELARQRKVIVDWVQADLENFTLPPAAFDVIVCTYFRDPKLYAPIRKSLRPGGLLFYETFSREQLRFNVGPKNPAHVLEPAELLLVFADWRVLFYRERWIDRGIAALIARKPAVQGSRQL
ncbi:MAG: class I SAM-dependent methyltransferase [Terriglobia bacterium]